MCVRNKITANQRLTLLPVIFLLVTWALCPALATEFRLQFQQMVYHGAPAQNDYFGSVLATGDFNGDGYDDLAVGCPSRTVSPYDFAGTVSVFFGTHDGLGTRATISDDMIVGGAAEARDMFGSALAVGDFNGDGYDDLAIGIPEEDNGALINVGAVAVVPGTSAGFSFGSSKTWTPDDAILHGSGEQYDYFGASLAVGNFNGDAYDDLVIGAPQEDIGSIVDAGEVHIIYGSVSGLSADVLGAQDFDQNAAGVPDVSETDDLFGWSLATGCLNNDDYDDLVIGIPYEDVEGVTNSGAVLLIQGSALGLTTNHIDYEDGSGAWGTAHYTNGYFGFTVAMARHRNENYGLAVFSSPGYDYGSLTNHGVNYLFYGVDYGFASHGYASAEPQSNAAGAAPLLFADINRDGYADLLTGQPRYDVGPYRDGGLIDLKYGLKNNISSMPNTISPYADDLPGNNQNDAQFGAALSMGDYNNDGVPDLAVGIPGYTVTGKTFAGAVMIMYGSPVSINGPLMLLIGQ